ncbi:MAG TPA: hypothetical protein VIV11_16810 [Kofleriaceae bacterium]
MPKCDTGKGMVALDGVMAGVSGLVALSLAGETEPAVALLPLAIGSIYVAGAIRGNSNANKCRAAMGQWENYMTARETLPPGVDVANRPQMPPMRPPAHQQPIDAEPDEGPPPMVAPPAPGMAPVPPPVAAPAAQQQPPPAPARPPQGRPAPPPKPAPDDDWSEFWREVD